MSSLNRNMIFSLLAGVSTSFTISSCSTTDVDVEQTEANTNESRITTTQEFDYIDGDYEAIGKYGSLPSTITVNVNISDDLITDVEVTPHATNPTSLDLQRRFAVAIPKEVVGKDIDEVKVGRLAGSSGTPDGFNDAIRQIKEQAKIEETPSN